MKITEKQIKDYHAQAEGSLQREIEKDYPEVFEVDLWDKWLVDDKFSNWLMFYQKENNKAIGFTTSGNWKEYELCSNPYHDNRNKPATHEQIIAMLSKEAVKRGYKEGNHKCLTGDTVKGEKIGFEYYFGTNSLYFNRNRIFHDGTWAAIVEPVYEWQYLCSNPNHDPRNKPATHEQILEKLSKEAVKRGYKAGNHKCLVGYTLPRGVTGFIFYADDNTLYLNGNCIFNNGTWAAIVEPVYEWQYLCRSPSPGVYGVSTGFYTNKKDFNTQNKDRIVISKIKESKRLRK
jgi:hypothetical protein